MTRTALTLLASLVALPMAVGCQNKKLQDENSALYRQNRELQSENSRLINEIGQRPDAMQLVSMQQELSARDTRIRELEDQLRQPTPGAGAQPGIEGIETSYDASRGEMTVDLPGDVLFDPGQDQLRASAKVTLDKIVKALKQDYAGRPIRVEGHTDADPISRSKDRYQDNLDLSLNRAAAVTRYLTEHGIQAQTITTSGFGETRPAGTKARSRRVEIVVVVR